MAVKTFKASGGAANKTKTSNRYVGDVPPAGAYRCKVKRMTVKNNSKGDPMITALFEVAEPETSKLKKYNGYGFFENFNITDVGAPFINAFLKAMVGNDAMKQKKIIDGLWDADKGIVARPDERQKEVYHVRKIGAVLIQSPDKIDFELMVSADPVTQTAGKNKGKVSLSANGYAVIPADDPEDEDDEDDFSDEELGDEDESESEKSDEDDESGEESDGDEDSEDEDEDEDENEEDENEEDEDLF